MTHDLENMNRQATQQALRYMGHFALPTLLMTAALFASYAMTYYLAFNGAMPLSIAVFAIAAITYMSYTPLHEAVHGNINGRHRSLSYLNDACGYLAAQIVLIPYASHREEHLAHHRHTNVPGKDPDFMLKDMGRSLFASAQAVLRFWWMQMTYAVKGGVSASSRNTRLIFLTELSVALAWRVALFVLAPKIMAIMQVGYFLGLAFTTYWFAYRPHLPYEDSARYRNTNSMVFPLWAKPVEWFWLGQNLHSIHHAFPRVPFYRYHALFRRIEAVMRANGNVVIDIFSRRPLRPHHPVAAKPDRV